jgi:hypothetical protein
MLLVRTTTAWELCQPVGAARPAQRTGHACVTYQDRIIVYVCHSFNTGSYSRFTGSEEQMANTITMIHGRMILIPGPGQNYSALDSFPRPGKATQPL